MKNKKTRNIRAEPVTNTVNGGWLVSKDAFETLTCQGYTSLSHNPEIVSAVYRIASLIGSMTIHLMQNTPSGDVRVLNLLSRKIDINPNTNMTRSNFITWIVKTLFVDGNGNCVVYPKTENGIIKNLIPIPPEMVSFIPDGMWDYLIAIDGALYEPDEVLHFVINPDNYYSWKGGGFRVALSNLANSLKQGEATKQGFMESKWKPSIIVKVDALTDEFSSKAGRKKLLEDYIETGKAGEPWFIPAQQFEIEQIKPLTLSDLALSDMMILDKKAVASILGVPPFVLGVGEFKRDEWNNFINTVIMPIAQNIQQEMTKKLLLSPDLYFRFNSRSLFNYDIKELAEVADEQFVRGIMTGNEVRDWLGLSPKENLDKLVILENYIPLEKIGNQSKLVESEGNENE